MRLKERKFTGTLSNEATERETENRKLARKAAAEGFVLLKNERQALPIKEGAKIGLYGAGAVKTVKGGTGSGDVNERDCISILDGLRLAGYEITSMDWLASYEELYDQKRQEWKQIILEKVDGNGMDFFQAYSTTLFQMPCGDPVEAETAKSDGADTAVFVLARIAGENADRRDVKGDYFITDEERELLKDLEKSYEKIVLVVNTGGMVDLEFIEEFPSICAVLQYVQAGQEGGSALAEVLSGKSVPCGKLTDSWACSYRDYPNAETFSFKNGDVDTEKYEEGIYVGYRYFDTFDVPVRYSFGYGLSYTEFEIHTKEVKTVFEEGKRPSVSVKVQVKNVGGRYAGKEVVQIYVSCPQGRLPKEFRRLAGFGKTSTLKPGQSQELTITFPLYQLASYDETKAAWILEAGSYGIWVGNSLAEAKLCSVLELDQETVMVQCGHICERKEDLHEICPEKSRMKKKEQEWLSEAERNSIERVHIQSKNIITEHVQYQDWTEELEGRAGEIVRTLSEEQLIELAAGDLGKGQGSALGSAGFNVPGAAAETSSAALAEPWNVAGIVLADGPAGLRLNQSYQVLDGEIQRQDFRNSFEGGFFAEKEEIKGTTYYQYCTAIPVGTLLAQTWNTELIRTVGEMIGREMELFQITLWLAPGMNIHRNPLCGRNFEYYSEDPLLSGIMASAMTMGVQSVPGIGTTIKHFACNNQEDNRMGSDSVVSERALREIYLKGFEIAVKDAQPMSMMTSYNMINGVHAANSYDLCTKAARDEWGFAGAVMTDWTTTNASTRGICTASGCMRAGNDMVMPGMPMDHENLKEELADGRLKIEDLRRCICNTVRLVLQSDRYEDAVSYQEQFGHLFEYLNAEKNELQNEG